jgi:phosphatidylinositol glycan class W
LLLVATVVSILAVDFPLIFPRRLCKTEEFGISLMDVGVGSVMFSSGLNQRKIRDIVLSKVVKSTILKDLIALFKGSFFIFLLAFARFIVHREIDYHVSDYH